MTIKRLLDARRRRKIPAQFSWVDHSHGYSSGTRERIFIHPKHTPGGAYWAPIEMLHRP